MQHSSTSRPGRLTRRAPLTALLTIAFAACGGDKAPTGATASLALAAASAQPGQAISAHVRGTVVPATPLAGTLDSLPVHAGRVDDSTLVLVVPEATPGTHQLRVTIGSATVSAPLHVIASQRPADATAFADSLLDDAEAVLAASATTFASDSALTAGIDPAAFERNRTALVTEMAAIRDQLAALSPAERAEAAAVVAANLPALREAMASAASATSRLTSTGTMRGPVASLTTTAIVPVTGPLALGSDDACTQGANCDEALTNYLKTFKRSAAVLGITLIGIDIASNAGGPGTKMGARIMNALAVGAFLGTNAEALMEWFVKPVIAKLEGDLGTMASLRAADGVTGSASLVTLTSPFTSGRPAAVPVTAIYRSITSGDLGLPRFAAVATAYAEMRQAWNALAAWVPFFDLAAPAIPASPARTVRRAVPPAQLTLGAITTPGVAGTTSASGDLWLVTFANPLQGTERPVDFAVRFLPPGLPEQVASYRITLRPAQYVVASVALTPAQDSIPLGSTLQMAAVARDSLGTVITGQDVTWASSRTSVAGVDASGLVSGYVIDTVTISATVGGQRMARRMRVVGDPFAGYTIELMDYYPDYTKASVEQSLQPRQSFTAWNGILYYMRLAYQGQPVGGWQQRADFANETRYPLGSQDYRVPDFQIALTDTLRHRSVSFPLDVTLSNAGYRAMAGRSVTVTQANSTYRATYTIDPSQVRNGHVGIYYFETCGSTTGTIEFKKKAMAAVSGSFYPASYIILFEDGTMGLNGGNSCPNRPDRYIVQ